MRLSRLNLVLLLLCVLSGLLIGEFYVAGHQWKGLDELRQRIRLARNENERNEAENTGLRLSRPKIEALYTRLNESVLVSSAADSSDQSENPHGAGTRAVAAMTRLNEAGFISQPIRPPPGEMSIIYEAASARIEFHRLVPLLADQENGNPFLYVDKLMLSRPLNVVPFALEPTYLNVRLTARLLTTR